MIRPIRLPFWLKDRQIWPHALAWGLVLLYIGFFTWLAILRHASFNSSGFDLGIGGVGGILASSDHGGIEARHEIGNRRVGAKAIVLDFHQTKHIGTDPHHSADNLRFLTLKLTQGIGTTRSGETTALSIAIKVVQYVKAGDFRSTWFTP